VIGNFFGQAQSIQIIRAFALILLLKSFINTEIFNIKRDLDFKKYFIYQIIPIFVDLALTVIALFVLQNVWALIIGAIIKQVIALILSFIICSRKPKVSFNLVIIKELFKYGRWIGISSIIILIATEGDDVFVAKYIGVAALGLYQMAYLISNSPTTEISHVMGQALLPYFSNKWRGLEIQRIIFTKMYIVVGMGIAVLSTMIYFLIDDFVILFLRDNWVGLIPLVRVLVIAGYFRAFAAITGSTLVALNKPHYDTMLQIVRLVILVIIGYFAFVMYGLIGIAWAVTISIAVSFLGYFIVSYKVLGFRVREVSYTFVYFISLFLLVKLVVLGIDGVGIESGFGRGVLEITGIIASAIAIEILLGKKAFLMLIEILKDKSVVQ